MKSSFRVLIPFKKSVTFIADSVFVHAKKTFPVRRLFSDKTIKEVKTTLAPSSQKIGNKDDNGSDSKNDSKGKGSGNNSSYWDMLKRKLTECKLTLGAIGVFVTVAASAYTFLNDLKNDAVFSIEKLSFAIKNAEITHSISDHFVHRPKIEGIINEALTYTFLKNGRYTIVYGPKGIGKTELIDHMTIGKKGVVKVKVSSANTKNGIIQSMTKKLVVVIIPSELDVDLFITAAKKSGIIPTIIFDIERAVSIDDGILTTIRSLSKDLAPYCRCIIVLSEANAVLKFDKDKRETFIYVDEMEREEAEQFMEVLRTNITKAEMKYVFEKIGTSPLDLFNLHVKVSPTYSINDYVADVLRDSKKRLVAFPHKPILKALKDHPEGVSPEYLKNQKNEGVDLSHPESVGVAMKSVNAIVYRIELDKYMLMSTAHRTALESYEPKVNKYYFF